MNKTTETISYSPLKSLTVFNTPFGSAKNRKPQFKKTAKRKKK